ncbi:hydrogenase-4 component E [Plastoroseomonas hellenica]|uniref:Hydrogenase-4 component E n=1 Tax=Plastoroseomonas hellenica TaxID=2687306 RepID=A0ABS5F411_9PROT|nr:hydrogenase-4 component E [Plastoroseomonas hellenica]MBR0645197.1 hydrogenase-4 component E [Plastoroseomonas hellenica]MBR0667256.1 hydrogenase-4 component E [Plastoroseomonas hellenica]
MTYGQLPYDIAHMLGGGVLLFSFVLLYQRRITAVINAFAMQGALVAFAAAWQGVTQDAAGLFLTAAIAFGAKAVAIPLVLRAMVRRLDLERGVETALGIGPSMIAGVGLVGLAILVVLPATTGVHALAREDLALSLSVVLLGMLMMITRRNVIGQVIGLMSLENGLLLAAIGAAGMPLVVELSTAALVLVLAIVAAVIALEMRERLQSLDTHALQDHRGEQG